MYTRKTMGDWVYEKLREEICSLEIEPGTKLSEVQLAENLGVSRAPVKSALNRLAYDGLVEIKPQSGTIVTPISFKYADNIKEIRLLLEPYAARKAVHNIPDRLIDEMRFRLLRLGEMKEDTKEKREYTVETDLFIHGIILEYCENEALCNVVKSYFPMIKRISTVNFDRHNRLSFVEQEIQRIVDALAARDEEKAYQSMKDHLDQIKHAKD